MALQWDADGSVFPATSKNLEKETHRLCVCWESGTGSNDDDDDGEENNEEI